MEIAEILIAILCIIYGAVKGINMLILAPCVAIIVIVSNVMLFLQHLLDCKIPLWQV